VPQQRGHITSTHSAQQPTNRNEVNVASAGSAPVSCLCEQELLNVAARHLLDGLAQRVRELRRATQVRRSRIGLALPISKASERFDNRGSVAFFIAHSVIGAPKSGRNITVANASQAGTALGPSAHSCGKRLASARSAARPPRPYSKATRPSLAFRHQPAGCRAAASSNAGYVAEDQRRQPGKPVCLGREIDRPGQRALTIGWRIPDGGGVVRAPRRGAGRASRAARKRDAEGWDANGHAR